MVHHFYRTVLSNNIPQHIDTNCFYVDAYVLIYTPDNEDIFFTHYPGLKEVVRWCDENLQASFIAVVCVRDEWLLKHNVVLISIEDDNDAAAYKLTWN